MIEIIDAGKVGLAELLQHREEQAPDVSEAVKAILADVRARGDVAVREYTERFDGAKLDDMRVSASEIEAAVAQFEPSYIDILREAAGNIRRFHEKQLRQGFVMADRPGMVLGQKVTPLARVGVYVPGGTAAYPSTVLMDVVPAQVAGVDEIVMTTPPGPDGKVNPVILAAASVLGVEQIYKVGGAQAIAALTYGTDTVPRVDKIVGPGNLYVATAKKLVYGEVGIDMIAGPSDVLVLADESAKAEVVAADMLAQAEHDKNAAAILVTTSAELARQVLRALEAQLAVLPRREIAEISIKNNGKLIVAESMAQAVEIANGFAPEHLEICTDDPFSLLGMVRNAGSIFLGHNTPEALGDYFAGPNHTLPTGGTSRFYSPLSVDDFVKKSSYLYYSQEALENASDKVIAFAQSEGLDGHARSVSVRFDIT
ncbi:histidinol dehydrogenase [Ruminococcaceae bacterium OttesenSCG-928-D13]|nr:histidinol dehydrogenase [Ruminococcaceae bacterium OttesenSCG-928-D13]